MSKSALPDPLPPSQGDNTLRQTVEGDRNQAIGQVSGGILINNLTIHDRVPSASVPPPVSEMKPLTQQEYRQRKVLLNKVKDYWVKGVLENSLHVRVLIELGLQERLDLVQRPFQDTAEFPKTSGQALPAGTNATAVFDQMQVGRTLLILGEPGSGKTITLLRLAQDLIAHTEADLRQPIPVVFNLSSWARKTQTIGQWLIQELLEKYQVSPALGKTWIAKESLILLLDGLDEVKAEQRNACVQALNQFMQDHGTTELALCCRIRDYQALTERLILRSAICIQPLNSQQIDEYFEQMGEQLSALKIALHQDAELQGLATSPLILSIMSLAYQGCQVEDVVQGGTPEGYHYQLFSSYVNRMLNRRCNDHCYTLTQVLHWLTWLAKGMTQKAQSVFLIEWIQPSWLNTQQQKIFYRVGVALGVGLIGGLEFGLVKEVLLGLLNRGFTAEFVEDLWKGLIQFAVFTPVLGVSTLLFRAEVVLVETLKWSWRKACKEAILWAIAGYMVGLIGGAVEGLAFQIAYPQPDATWLTVKVYAYDGVVGAIAGLIYGLTEGMVGSEIEAKIIPNQAVWRSALNAFLFSLAGAIVGGFIGRVVEGLMDSVEVNKGLIDGMTIGWIGGFLGGGGLACIKHLILRLMFCWLGYSPWNYTRFLDHATERLFLQKVGGGYIFVHRMLLEHFAAMPLEQGRR